MEYFITNGWIIDGSIFLFFWTIFYFVFKECVQYQLELKTNENCSLLLSQDRGFIIEETIVGLSRIAFDGWLWKVNRLEVQFAV